MFDDIPEDGEKSYPCECGGDIIWSGFDGQWVCNLCGKVMDDEEGM